MPTREAVFEALFALSEGVLWGAPARGFAHRSRRVALWGDLPAQPALCQAEHDEDIAQVTGMPFVSSYSANWLIYHDVGKDPAAVPARESNLILDSIQALFPVDEADGAQTLGGLVHHCFISGKVFKDPGDLDGQALIIVPIKILVP